MYTYIIGLNNSLITSVSVSYNKLYPFFLIDVAISKNVELISIAIYIIISIGRDWIVNKMALFENNN